MTRYYRRRRALPILTGYATHADGSMTPDLTEPVKAMTTRYYWRKRRRADARRPWGNVYYHAGTWYRSINAATLDAAGNRVAYVNALEPVTGRLLNRHLAQTIEQGRAAPVEWLDVEAGRVVRGTDHDGIEWLTGADDPDYIAELLDVA